MKKSLLLLSIVFLSALSFAQQNTLEHLCIKIIEANTEFDVVGVEILQQKFEKHQEVLSIWLSGSVLVDSSTLYNDELKQLQVLEQQEAKDNEQLLRKYLKISLLKPSKSRALYTKAIPLLLENEKARPAKDGFWIYKIWLYELLESRFNKETTSFSKNKAIGYYNQISRVSKTKFQSYIKETRNLKLLDSLANMVTPQELTAIDTSKLLTSAFLARASFIEKLYTPKGDRGMFNSIELYYTKTLEIDSNNLAANHNLGTLYYNEGVNRIKTANNNTSKDVLEQLQQETVDFFKKAKPYMEMAKKLKEADGKKD